MLNDISLIKERLMLPQSIKRRFISKQSRTYTKNKKLEECLKLIELNCHGQ